ncbi:uncharacterized protein MONBRDRAFT_37019 [Monosiga brevicollis MX1]|uniref:PH domain-containing protein n=1 Tax=Monosiga brevicollis TaxID=81824 RepID=A9UZ25_MONBE|nr:uncharacterized protein MONBRDRAFT_37019 [Monosiga brevicollis MX1]EDQ89559.1 predicted protein [Monosiga brevicollis MX1]|eukprot:XP_001745588.1 hypothetical protein [Monosiga brevicollis MX1]
MIDDAVRKEVQEETQRQMTDFGKDFMSAYKGQLVGEAIEKHEAGEEEGPALELQERPESEPLVDTEPLKTATFIKRGDVRKNWKERFFVVRKDHNIDYYESEQAFKDGKKPKGTINLSGYEVVTDPNGRKIKQKQDQAKEFGEEIGDVEYDKYEPLTMECFHDSKRRWLFKFETQDQFDEWAITFAECSKLVSSRTMEDDQMYEAFQEAYTARKSHTWYYYWKNYSGTEADMLTDLLTDNARRRFLESTIRNLTGPIKMKKVALGKIVAFLRTIISGIVKAQFTALITALNAVKETVKKGLETAIGPIVELRGKLCGQLDGSATPIINPVAEKVLSPMATALAGFLSPTLYSAYVGPKPEFEKECKRYSEKVADGSPQDSADQSLRWSTECSYWMYHDGFDYLYKIVDKYSDLKGMLPDVVRSNETMSNLIDSYLDLYSWTWNVRSSIRALYDRAAYTYTQAINEDPATANEKHDAVFAATWASFEHDAKFSVVQNLADFVTGPLSFVLKDSILEKLTPLLEPIDSLIPETLQEMISGTLILETVLDNHVGSIASGAAEAAWDKRSA